MPKITSFLEDDQDNQVLISYGSYDYGIKTQAEINALTPIVGAKVFNSDTNKIQTYNGVAFIDIALISDIQGTTIIPTAESTTVLDNSSTKNFIFTGTTFGKVINLGNATTYLVGKGFKLFNNSTQTISIVDNGSVEIYRLEPHCKLEILLQDNTIANGVWIFSNVYPSSDKIIEVNDDFISGINSGQTGWTATVAGGGASISSSGNLFNRVGVEILGTGNTATGRACLNKGGNIIIFNNGVHVFEKSVLFDNLSTAADRYTIYGGFGDNVAAGDMLDGVYFEYAESVSGNFWRLKTSSNATRTITVTTVPIVANTWYKLKIEVAPLGTRADFFIDNVNVGNITTNIPNAINRNTGQLFKIEKSVGATSRNIYVDFANYRAYLTR